MKPTTVKSLLLATAAALSFSSPGAGRAKPADYQVLVYGIVEAKQCGSLGYYGYTKKLVKADEVAQTKKSLREKLTADNPTKKVRVGDSKFDFGPEARYMTALKWTVKNEGCSYDVLVIEFGKTQEQALGNATSRKDSYAGKKTPYSIVEQTYW